MAGSVYQVKLRAILEKGTLEKELKKSQAEIKSKKLDLISMRVTVKDNEVTQFTRKIRDSTGKIIAETKKIGATYDKQGKIAGAAIQTITKETEKGAKSTNYFAKGMQSAAKSAAGLAASLGLVRLALNAIGDGVQYIKDLDVEMRNISLVTGVTGDVISDLALDYNSLAKEMGATTLEVAAGSLEWIRQGKTLEETQELLQATLMLSKLGNVESAEATEHLTAVLNSYKLEAEDAVRVVDKLVAIDNKSATSVEEMSVAFRKAAVSAAQAGIDIDHLAAYVGTVLSVTREAPERVGTAFKTMTARFRDIKAGALDGEGAINNVEAALNRVTLASGEQMSIMNRQTGEFKDFTVVIEQLAGEWGTLGDIEQENIIKAVAGKQNIYARNYGDIMVYA